jgi:hypothetical protein
MKRSGGYGRAAKVEVGENGLPLSPEEARFRKKNIDFTKFKWP